MNFKNILNEIEQSDPEVYEKLSDRRHVLKSFGSKVAVAALPFAIGSLFNKAYGKTSSANVVVDALNVALEMEYMEYNLYHIANNTGGLIPAADQPGFQAIEAQEKAHINFLNTAITTLGGVPFTPKYYSATSVNPLYVSAAYDFTLGSVYATFSDYANFLIIAQVLEDTGIHAYKGQVPAFVGNKGVLTQAFQVQATEGRHASYVRLLRRLAVAAPEYPAPWINNNIPPTINLQSYYLTEDVTAQSGVDLLGITDTYAAEGTVPKVSATAAFDEPYSAPTIASLIAPFKKP